MFPLFQSACKVTGAVTLPVLNRLLDESQQKFGTGLLQLDLPQQNGLVLALVRGKLINIYRMAVLGTEQVSADEWMEVKMALPQCTAYSLNLTPPSLRLAKIILEHPQQGDVLTVETANFRPWLASWAAHPAPAAIHCRWESAETAFILPGSQQAPVDALWVDNSLREQINLVDMLKGWKETSCLVTRCGAATETDAWIEYSLMIAFNDLIMRLLKRYEQFAGSSLVLTICRDASLNAARRGWDISLSEMLVKDEEVFNHPDVAAQVYRTLTSTVTYHIYAVLGGSQLNTIVHEILRELEPQSRRMVQQYAFLPATLFPQIEQR